MQARQGRGLCATRCPHASPQKNSRRVEATVAGSLIEGTGVTATM